MHLFTARYRTQIKNILIHKDMSVNELLEALSYSLQLSDGVIVGFQDRTGLIITPSYVCCNPQDLRNDTYDVMLKNNSHQANPIIQALNQTQAHSQPSLFQDTSAQQPMRQNSMMDMNASTGGGVGEKTLQMGNFSNINPIPSTLEEEVLLVIRSIPSDAFLTDNIKNKIIQKARQRDNVIVGAYQIFLNDGDIEAFKARLYHRVVVPCVSDYPSSASTANFNWSQSRTSTAAANLRPQTREHSRVRAPTVAASVQNNVSQDRFLPVILELENRGLLDEQTACLVKTLILEENLEVFRTINLYIARAISERELSYRLSKLSQQLGTYMERPQSPIPRRKNQLLAYVNSLARYHFADPIDVQLLNQLIQEENEFVLSCFDVFESDQDHDNLVDSLHRIIEKSKTMGLQQPSMTAQSFYKQNPWSRSHNPSPAQNISNSATLGSSNQYSQKWDDKNTPIYVTHNQYNPTHLQPAFQSSERPSGAVGGKRYMGAQAQNLQYPPQNFEQTTVQNVALIPNYFSSGEEEQPYVQRPSRFGYGYPSNKGSQKNVLVRPRDLELARESASSEAEMVLKVQDQRKKDKKSKQRKQDDSDESSVDERKASRKRKSDKKNKKSKSKKSDKKSKKKAKISDSDSSDSSSEDQKPKKKTKKAKDSSSDSSVSRKNDSSSSSASSSSSDNRKAKKSKSKKAKSSRKEKKQPEAISRQRINEIIEEEEVQAALRNENYGMLMFLLDNKDQDLINIFDQFTKNQSSEYFITSVEGKTEETLDLFFSQHFDQDQVSKLRQMRSHRDDNFRSAFKKFKKNQDIPALVKALSHSIDKNIKSEQKGSTEKMCLIRQTTRKEKADGAFQMILYGGYLASEKGSFLQLKFDQQDDELYRILDDYSRHNNYHQLKSSVDAYVDRYNQNDVSQLHSFSTLKQAIEELQRNGDLTTQDATLLEQLNKKNDKHIRASWEAYTFMKNEEELADTLAVLCGVKRETLRSQQQQDQSSTNAMSGYNIERQGDNTNITQNNREHIYSSSSSNGSKQAAQKQSQQPLMANGMPQISFMRLSAAQSPNVVTEDSNSMQQRAEDQEADEDHLNIEDNPDDSDNNEDINNIINYQHKILSKYSLMGMISYADAPCFHAMVDQRDYKMISIFEVFAINRNEDDFLENLGLFAQLVLETDQFREGSPEGEAQEQEAEEDLSDPKIKLVHQFKDKLTEEEFKWCIQALTENSKMVITTINVFNATKDANDFVHSLKKLAKLNKK